MILWQAEFSLIAVAAGLFLYDSALLLYCNEGVLMPRGCNGWVVRFGSDKIQLMGKEVYIPNPFLIHRPMFRLAWNLEGAAADAQWQPARDSFRVLVPLVWCMAIALFVLLPLGLFSRLGEPMLMLAMALLYGSLLASLLWTWFNRRHLELSARQLAALSFECMLCSPFALNLIRHLSVRTPVQQDLEHAARRLQSPVEWVVTRAALIARLDDEIEGEQDGSARLERLQQHRCALAAEDA